MQILHSDEFSATCTDSEGNEHTIDVSLIGPQSTGNWVMTFLGAARRTMDEEEAQRVIQALSAMAAITRGESIEHLFADLVDREPRLPSFLLKEKA